MSSTLVARRLGALRLTGALLGAAATVCLGAARAEAQVAEPPPITGNSSITGMAISNPRPDSITIHWTTAFPADSEVEYGASTALGTTVYDGTLVVHHAVTLKGLRPATQYHYRITSNEANGLAARSGMFSFMTAPLQAEAATARAADRPVAAPTVVAPPPGGLASAPASGAPPVPCSRPDPFVATGGVGICVGGVWLELWRPMAPASSSVQGRRGAGVGR